MHCLFQENVCVYFSSYFHYLLIYNGYFAEKNFLGCTRTHQKDSLLLQTETKIG